MLVRIGVFLGSLCCQFEGLLVFMFWTGVLCLESLLFRVAVCWASLCWSDWGFLQGSLRWWLGFILGFMCSVILIDSRDICALQVVCLPGFCAAQVEGLLGVFVLVWLGIFLEIC